MCSYAAGTGLWINIGGTAVYDRLGHHGVPTKKGADGLTNINDVLDAASRGLGAVQYVFGDPTGDGALPPLLIVTRHGCLGRREAIKACMPDVDLFAGWHDLPCRCVDRERPLPLHLRGRSNDGSSSWKKAK